MDRIEALKAIRTKTGCSLATARAALDALCSPYTWDQVETATAEVAQRRRTIIALPGGQEIVLQVDSNEPLIIKTTNTATIVSGYFRQVPLDPPIEPCPDCNVAGAHDNRCRRVTQHLAGELTKKSYG